MNRCYSVKSNNYSISSLIKKNNSSQEGPLKIRNTMFLEIIEPIYKLYQNHLLQRKEIDFSDMINKASEYITNGQYSKKYRYIIIDEFQDISIARYQLVKALKLCNPACKLFCVGDDWQSIYRFTGSDIALFKDFEQFFGHTVKSKIETTYRFSDPLLQLSSSFIQKNPNQSNKELRSYSDAKSTEFSLFYSLSENGDDTLAIQQVLDKLVETVPDVDKKKIYLLSRYNNDINRVKNNPPLFKIDKKSKNPTLNYSGVYPDGRGCKIKLEYYTVHKSKGDEADIVIIMNCNSGKYGFPSGMSDDLVLNLLLSQADQFESGEERRLFYVAMTRAKESVIFIADTYYKSKFITELEIATGGSGIRKCPRCKSADLVKRSGTTKGKPWAFWGCSNYGYGCKYRQWIKTPNKELPC